MKTDKLTDRYKKRLILFFGGWGTRPEQFAGLQVGKETNRWISYDYTQPPQRPEGLAEELMSYQEVHVVAWSLGVWAAEEAAQNFPFHFTSATAINGTSCPISNTLGIPEATFQGTLEGLSPESLSRFNRRMCGSRDVLARYDSLPARPFPELKDELAALNMRIHQSKGQQADNLWTQAILCTDDRIFPIENQRRFWQDRCPLTELKAPHYPFHLFNSWEELWKR
ncbi:MAG: DUF452 family protein [Tannerellaceae bacterium]